MSTPCLARIHYELNDLEDTSQRGQRALELADMLQNTDRPAACQVLLARTCSGRPSAGFVTATTFGSSRASWLRSLGCTWFVRGAVDMASCVADEFDLPMIAARVLLAREDPAAALARAAAVALPDRS